MEHGGIIGKIMTKNWTSTSFDRFHLDLTSRRYWNDGEWGTPKWLDISG